MYGTWIIFSICNRSFNISTIVCALFRKILVWFTFRIIVFLVSLLRKNKIFSDIIHIFFSTYWFIYFWYVLFTINNRRSKQLICNYGIDFLFWQFLCHLGYLNHHIYYKSHNISTALTVPIKIIIILNIILWLFICSAWNGIENESRTVSACRFDDSYKLFYKKCFSYHSQSQISKTYIVQTDVQHNNI